MKQKLISPRLNYNDCRWYETEDDEYTILADGAYKDKTGEYYFKKGKLHREDGPAVIEVGYHSEWWMDGSEVYSIDVNKLHDYDNLSESFKRSIIKWELSK
jgi:hypothetical protein